MSYLLCLVINNGEAEEVDIRDLLADNQDESSPPSDFENSAELSNLNDTFISPAKADKVVMEKLRKLLLLGKCKEFVEMAMSERLWGLALRFSKLMSHSLFVEVCHKFDTEHFNAVDPIQAYINVKTGTQLNVAHIEEASNFDWKRHLNVILANSESEKQRQFYCSELGSILAARGKYFASQLCYLVGNSPFGMPSENLTHLVLIGLGPTRSENLGFKNVTQNYFCIILTMIYEYAVRNNYPDFFIPFLQYCKFFVARRYVDCGHYEMAYRFCDSIAVNVKREPSRFDMTFISQLKELSRMLMFKLSRHEDQWMRNLESVSSNSSSQSVELFSSVVDCTSSRVEKGSSTGPLMASWDESTSNCQTPFASSTVVNHSKQSSPVVHTSRKDSDSVDKPSPAVIDFFSIDSQKDDSKAQRELNAASSPKNQKNNMALPSFPTEVSSQNLDPRPGPAVPEDEECAETEGASNSYLNSGSYTQFNPVSNHLPETAQNESSINGPFSDPNSNYGHIHSYSHFDHNYSNPNQELEAELEGASTDDRSINDSTLVSSQQFSESFPQVPPPPEEPFPYSYSSNLSTQRTNTNIYEQSMNIRSSAQHNFLMNPDHVLELGEPTDFYSEQQMFGAQNTEESRVHSSKNSGHRSSLKSKSSFKNSEACSGSCESAESSESEVEDKDEEDMTTDLTTTKESGLVSSLENLTNASQSPKHRFSKAANQGLATAHNKSKINFVAPVNDFNASLDQNSFITAAPPPGDLSSYSMSHISSMNKEAGLKSQQVSPKVPPPIDGAPNPFSRSANSNKLNQYKQYPNAFKISEAANIAPPSFPTPQHMYEPSLVPQNQENFTAPSVPQSSQTATEPDAAPIEPRSNFYGAPNSGHSISANSVEPADESNFVPVIPTFFNPKSFKSQSCSSPQIRLTKIRTHKGLNRQCMSLLRLEKAYGFYLFSNAHSPTNWAWN